MQILTVKGPGSGPVDKFVLWSVLLLSAVGIVAVYSAIAYFAATAAGGGHGAVLISAHVSSGDCAGCDGCFLVYQLSLPG